MNNQNILIKNKEVLKISFEINNKSVKVCVWSLTKGHLEVFMIIYFLLQTDWVEKETTHIIETTVT